MKLAMMKVEQVHSIGVVVIVDLKIMMLLMMMDCLFDLNQLLHLYYLIF
jgi:hypothetical protein